MLLQERNELRLKIALLMMLLLPRNVRDGRIDLRLADGERAITLLPLEGLDIARLVHPPR